MGLDLSKVQKKGESTPQPLNLSSQPKNLNIYKVASQEGLEKSSVGKNSDVAHIIGGLKNNESERSNSHY